MQKYFFKIVTLIVAFISLSMFGFMANASDKASAGNNKMLVVTTFSILQDMAMKVGGDKVEVVSLIARKADAHTFEPSPKTVKEVVNAKLLISNGLGFETWLDRLLQSSSFNGKHVVASQGVQALSFKNDHDENHHANHGDHIHQGLDPHAWQSIQNGIIYVQNIAQAMGEVDAVNKDYYLQRAEEYIKNLLFAEELIQNKINVVKPENRNAVTAHDAFAYFAKAYNVNFISVAGISTQAEPSAKELANLMQVVADLPKVAFFVEFGTNPRMIKQLAKEANLTVGDPLYSDTLDDANHGAGSYLGIMLWNADELSKNLK